MLPLSKITHWHSSAKPLQILLQKFVNIRSQHRTKIMPF
jgi:hypothetical protein